MTVGERQPSLVPAFLRGAITGFFVAFFLCVVVFGLYIVQRYDGAQAPVGDTIAIRWSDAVNPDGTLPVPGRALYGMHVYVKPAGPGGLGPFDVYTVCYIGRPGGVTYMDDIGKIGSATNWADANTRYGVIRFTPAGVYVGDGVPAPDGSEDDFLFPTSRMTSHR